MNEIYTVDVISNVIPTVGVTTKMNVISTDIYNRCDIYDECDRLSSNNVIYACNECDIYN